MSSAHAWLAAEPFTLVLSAGFFGFFAHAGVILALDQAGLVPQRIIGVSAGAIAGGAWASGLEPTVLARTLFALRREEFWDPSWRELGQPGEGSRLGLLRGRKLGRLLDERFGGVDRIEHCPIAFRPLTHDLLARQGVVHASGPLGRTIRASAALPLLFGPVRLAGRLHMDGGISDRSGLSATEVGERVLYHHLPRGQGTGLSRLVPSAGTEAEDRRANTNRAVLAIAELPRVGPHTLHRGRLALEQARAATTKWLHQPRINPAGRRSDRA